MNKRLQDKVVAVFGAGSSGEGWSNGKAAAVLYARQGARVCAIDIDSAAAAETDEIIREKVAFPSQLKRTSRSHKTSNASSLNSSGNGDESTSCTTMSASPK